ncbi:hypothetical protein HC235_00140 [Pyrobaculum arsenaticum]|nr:hypothetical protein [Pyrobaculum arsenaticum]NYR14405.1 hypothetical protein [Pyrobaculum arsenaticum]
MSIKPRFGDEILSGSKKYELRRLVGPLVELGDVVYLYFTRPVSAVAGRFTAGLVFIVPPENLGRLLAELGDVGIGEDDLKYVEGARYAMLIQVRNPARCRAAVRLSEIGEPPPPSYRKIAKKKAEQLATLCGF